MTDDGPRFTRKEFNQIRYLFYFAVFIILFQVFQYITTKNALEKYKILFSHVREMVILTNSVSLETSTIHRAILNLSFSSDSSDVVLFRKKLADSEIKIENKIAIIENKIITYDLYSFEKTLLFENLKLAKKQYTEGYGNYFTLLSDSSKAVNFRRKILRPALDEFQRHQFLFIERFFVDQKILIDSIAEDSDKTGFRLLITGNILLGLVVIVIFYILLSERKRLI